MIQVLLLILKIVGMTLLVLLGLLLLILVLVLFVPVFYRVRVVHTPEKTQVKARASFLFPCLLVTFEYLKKISYKVRIFGIPLLDSDKPKKEKPPKKQKAKKAKKKRNLPAEPISKPETEPVLKPEINSNSEVEDKTGAERKDAQDRPSEAAPSSQTGEKTKKQGFFEKIKGKIQKIRETISNTVNKIKRLWRIKNEVQRILEKPETKEALRFAWDKLKRLLKHILPRKIKGYAAYGADDPATTGQVLGVLSVVYARTGQLLEIRPNFTEKQLECDVLLTGRIQVFTLLAIAVKVALHQELRQLINDFKRLKEIE